MDADAAPTDPDSKGSASRARPPFELRVLPRERAVAELADELERLLAEARAHPRPFVLGLATGRTMEPLYAELGARVRAGRASFGRVRAFALDEYCGLSPEHPARMRAELERTLLALVDLPPEQLELPPVDGEPGPAALEARCDGFERALRAAGGVDLQLLGIGTNGHVAFNEPGSAPDSLTRRVHLASATRAAAAERFGGLEQVPSAAVTQGLGTIRRARRLRLLAFGASKAEAVAALVAARPDPGRPATWLVDHPDLRVWVDEAAASRLSPRGASAPR